MDPNKEGNDDLDTGESFPQTIGEERDEDHQDLIGDEEDDDTGGNDDPVAQLRQESREREERYMRTINQLLATQQGRGADTGGDNSGDAGTIDFDDLPDPVEDRKGFNKALAEKFGTVSQAQRAQIMQDMQRQNAVTSLETRFKTKYTDLAGKSALMRAAVQEEADAMRAEGLDPQQAAMNDQDGFIDRVANRMKKELGQGDTKPRGRTRGVSAGSRQKGSNKPPKEKPKGFLDQLKEAQLDSGLI